MTFDPAKYLKAKLLTEDCAQEILGQLHEALVGREITLADGSKGKVQSYYPAETDEMGNVSCGVEVVLDNGLMVEFTMKNTGFGRPMVDFAKKPEGERER